MYVYVFAYSLSQPFLQVKLTFMAIMLWKMQQMKGFIKSIDDSAWTCAQKCNYMERRAWVKKNSVLYIYIYFNKHMHIYICAHM